jgi:protein-S-isoprenylcysteine O-methyltransferase Ste14
MSERTTWQRVARRIRVPLGFVFAAVFLWLARPTVHSMLWSLLLVVPGVWLRAFASGYVRKNTELTTTGPYAHTRNPLYLGSMMIAFGFAAAAQSWVILVALAVLFTVIYLPTIRSEEEYLRSQFAGFNAYAARVPRLLPRITPAPTDAERGRFSPSLYRHHHEYNCGTGAIAIYGALAVRLLFFTH